MPVTRVELPETFKIDQVGDVYAELEAGLASDDAIEIEGAAVKVVDFAAVQLLLVFAKHCAEHERNLTLNHPADALRTAFDEFGAGGYLGIA